jgi:DNA invertase Pin-like site-specific DNA recombinase
MKAIIYARVSSQVQENDSQIKELQNYAKSKGIQVVKVFQEKKSGAKPLEEREELTKAIAYLDNHNDVKKVLVWEFSRIGRKVTEVKRIIELFHNRKVSVYIKNFDIETLDNNGKESPMSSFMISILSAVYEMEKANIKQRLDRGYNAHRENGGKVGRKIGYVKPITETKNYKTIVDMLNKGNKLKDIVKATEVSPNTIRKVKAWR